MLSDNIKNDRLAKLQLRKRLYDAYISDGGNADSSWIIHCLIQINTGCSDLIPLQYADMFGC